MYYHNYEQLLRELSWCGSPRIELVDADKWADAETAVTVLSLATAIKALTLFSAPVLQAIGRTYTLAALTWFHAAVASRPSTTPSLPPLFRSWATWDATHSSGSTPGRSATALVRRRCRRR